VLLLHCCIIADQVVKSTHFFGWVNLTGTPQQGNSAEVFHFCFFLVFHIVEYLFIVGVHFVSTLFLVNNLFCSYFKSLFRCTFVDVIYKVLVEEA